MPVNKNASLRYIVLDECFSNRRRNFYIDDLVEACNIALSEFNGVKSCVKKRQIYDDIRYMTSDQGLKIELERGLDEKKRYYRYADPSFSISQRPINKAEAKQLQETIMILSRFKGIPQFEWMEEVLARLSITFNLHDNNTPIVGFEQNTGLKGLEYFSELFNHIRNKNVLDIKYQSFKRAEAADIAFYPYFLKQFNNRWFLLGKTEKYPGITTLALDRISGITINNSPFIENSIDFEKYYENVVGVTLGEDKLPEKISLQITAEWWPYIKTKPLHSSQKEITHDDKSVTIEIEVIINNELIALLFSYGEKITVIAPVEFKLLMKNKAEKLFQNYI